MMTWKGAVSIVAAFGLGALVVYDIMSHQPRTNPGEEWGVVVVHFAVGASLWGLFESKAECLDARAAYMKDWGRMAGAIKKDARSMMIEGGKYSQDQPVTFSCLPLSEIRGLHLADGGRTSN